MRPMGGLTLFSSVDRIRYLRRCNWTLLHAPGVIVAIHWLNDRKLSVQIHSVTVQHTICVHD